MRERGAFGSALGAAVAVGLGISLITPLARAQKLEAVAPLFVEVDASSAAFGVSFDVTSVFTERFRRRLNGGLTSRVLIEMTLVDRSGAEIVQRARECALRLDIWEDRLFLRIQDASRVERRTFELTDDALRECGTVKRVPLVDRALLGDAGEVRLYVKVGLNPVPPELLEKTREFTWNPRGAQSGRPRVVIGAVAKLFRSDPEAGGEIFYFRSRPFGRFDAETK